MGCELHGTEAAFGSLLNQFCSVRHYFSELIKS